QQLSEQIIALTLERLVWRDTDVHVQISGATTTRACGSAAGEAPRRPGVDTGRHVDLEGLLGDDPAFATARRARRDDHLPEAAAPRADAGGHHLAEHALAAPLHLAAPVALRACDRLRSGTGTGAVAIVAPQCGSHGHADRRPQHRSRERDTGHDTHILH